MSTTFTATRYSFNPNCTTFSVKQVSPLTPGVREQRWFYAHEAEMVAQYGGRWIAISGETVIGVGDGASEAAEQARARGFSDMALIQVPKRLGEWDNLIA
ncbi:hypothetical protein LCGC14_0382280 [marine sediment metagenome]|uniref:DUF5678 domain-containing protein n=1 Tax=marine sediment metagenome TaxID=412755 RepID=A0A0F9T7S0_9ZZZZ